jgi:purine catabolism regulator
LCTGKSVSACNMVHESYKQAKKVHTISQAVGIKEQHINLDQLGVYQLLYLLSENEEAQSFRDKFILPLLEYESKHHTSFIETLKVYFEHNQNVRKTADALFTHYNTIVHRLDRVGEVLNLNMNKAEKRLQLELAIRLYEMSR